MADDPSKMAPSSARPVRDPKTGRILKGVTLNPGGRPKGVAARIREKTRDGEYLIEKCFDILEGREKATTRDKIDVLRLLWERGHGKTPEINLTGELNQAEKEAVEPLNTDQLEAIAEANDERKNSAA